jgi:uncharacterized protein (TIGR03000 family)
MIRVLVPAEDAEIWFDGAATKQRGRARLFVSPALEASGKYQYTIKARWMESGRPVDQERQVQVQPGGQPILVDFRASPGAEKVKAPKTPEDKTLPKPLPKDEKSLQKPQPKDESK